MSLVRALIQNQRRLSVRLDRLLPVEYRVDGNSDFKSQFAPRFVRLGALTYDVGGGKRLFFSALEKESHQLRVVGVDIDAQELARAAPGCFDNLICADVTQYTGNADGELVVCCTLLEHVKNTDAAIACIASLLKKDGIALIFVPSRRALFAKLNLLLPERLKRWLLFSIFPETSPKQGFPSYYDRCSPEEMQRLCQKHWLTVIEAKYYFVSSYFSFFFPLYLLWRAWILSARWLCGNALPKPSPLRSSGTNP
jgi:2-polyprenyl-6-hydroxyphenyl methylase/3-demethylubiquinone-9 3-methyltransferase